MKPEAVAQKISCDWISRQAIKTLQPDDVANWVSGSSERSAGLSLH
jgi:hypothetical protein